MTTYVLVDQCNWREEGLDNQGKPVTFLTYKKPPSLEAAHDWPKTEVIEDYQGIGIPTRWGNVTYRAEPDGSLVYAGNDCDSSG